MKVELVDKMGSDLTVVNAARVSFNKHHDEWKDSDERLIRYLAKNGHWTPFGHSSVQFRISAPIFVARQLVIHQIGLVWNEVSRRYVDYTPDIYTVPADAWRGKPVDAKQGSTGLANVTTFDELNIEMLNGFAKEIYKGLIDRGVAPEQARMVLPLATYTEWYWTGSLMAFARVCNLRLDKTAQEETQEIARQISEHCATLFPVSWKYLVQYSEE